MIFGSEKVLVAVAAGDTQGGAGSEDARAGDFASLDAVANCEVGVAGRADVADGGEPGFESDAGIADAQHRGAWIRDVIAGHAEKIGRAGDVSVAINQAGKDGGSGEVDALRARRELRFDGGGIADLLDAIAFDPDDLIGAVASGADVENFSGFHGDDLGRRGGLGPGTLLSKCSYGEENC